MPLISWQLVLVLLSPKQLNISFCYEIKMLKLKKKSYEHVMLLALQFFPSKFFCTTLQDVGHNAWYVDLINTFPLKEWRSVLFFAMHVVLFLIL